MTSKTSIFIFSQHFQALCLLHIFLMVINSLRWPCSHRIHLLVWQIHTVCVIKWKESSAVDRTPNKVIYSIITIAGKKQKKYFHKYLYLQYTKGFCDPPPNLIRRMCTKQPPLLLQNPVCHHFPPSKRFLNNVSPTYVFSHSVAESFTDHHCTHFYFHLSVKECSHLKMTS